MLVFTSDPALNLCQFTGINYSILRRAVAVFRIKSLNDAIDNNRLIY